MTVLFLKTCLAPVEYARNFMSYIPRTATLLILRRETTPEIQGNDPETHANPREQHKRFGACFQIS